MQNVCIPDFDALQQKILHCTNAAQDGLPAIAPVYRASASGRLSVLGAVPSHLGRPCSQLLGLVCEGGDLGIYVLRV